MKKILLLSIILFANAFYANAQLKEVRGVLTKCVEYDSEKDGKIHGFQFTNENNYPVWVEAELSTQGFVDTYDDRQVVGGVRDTKSFTLQPKESYLWQCGKKMVWNGYDYYDRYYVQYKAYRVE